MDDFFAPKVNFEQLDRRACIANNLGLTIFYGSIFAWPPTVPFVILEHFKHYHIAVTMTSVLLIVAGPIAFSAVLAKFVIRLIGGKASQETNVTAEFSTLAVHLGENLTLRKSDIRKVRIRRYKDLCLGITIHLHSGGQVKINPIVSENLGLGNSKEERWLLCELIHNRLSVL